LILYAWRKHFGKLFNRHLLGIGIQSKLNSGLGKLMRSHSPFKLLLLGGLNGLLPCGMVFFALTNAILTGDILSSGFAMLAFGVGTLPAMISVIFMMNKISISSRKKMSKAVPYLLTVVGLLVILRGMNLGIPFISPSAKVIEHKVETNDGTELEMELDIECCH